MNNNNDIDVVVLWVDGSDPLWLAEKSRYIKTHGDIKDWRDWDTIRFVLRGIDQFMPWVNNIHFVTYGHVPKWLNLDAPKIKIIKHSDFFYNKKDIPTFNSTAIEMNLGNIPQLSENFIYFNDDTLVLKNTPISRFFQNNLPLDFLEQDIPRKGYLYKKIRSNDPFVYHVNNDISLINQHFSKKRLLRNQRNCFYSRNYSTETKFKNFIFNILYSNYQYLKLYHFAQPYKKSTLIEAKNIYKEEMSISSALKCRSNNSINQYLFRFLHLAKGNFIPYNPKDTFSLQIKNANVITKYKDKILSSRFVCANDDSNLSNEEFEKSKKVLTDILLEILPEKSVYEK